MLSGEEGKTVNDSVSLERPLADSDRLEVTIKHEGQTAIQPPSGWTLTPDDIVETRRLSQSQSMHFPCDADTTRRLEQLKYVVDGRSRVSWWRRLLRRLKRPA